MTECKNFLHRGVYSPRRYMKTKLFNIIVWKNIYIFNKKISDPRRVKQNDWNFFFLTDTFILKDVYRSTLLYRQVYLGLYIYNSTVTFILEWCRGIQVYIKVPTHSDTHFVCHQKIHRRKELMAEKAERTGFINFIHKLKQLEQYCAVKGEMAETKEGWGVRGRRKTKLWY